MITKEINLTCGGYLPCLNCGEIIKLDGDIHFCDNKRNEWLNKQEIAEIYIPNVGMIDLKRLKQMEKQ